MAHPHSLDCIHLSFLYVFVNDLLIYSEIMTFPFEFFELVNIFDARIVWCIAFGGNWLRIEQIVDGLNVVMALIICMP